MIVISYEPCLKVTSHPAYSPAVSRARRLFCWRLNSCTWATSASVVRKIVLLTILREPLHSNNNNTITITTIAFTPKVCNIEPLVLFQ